MKQSVQSRIYEFLRSSNPMSPEEIHTHFPNSTIEQVRHCIGALKIKNKIHNIGTQHKPQYTTYKAGTLLSIKSTDTCLTATRAIVSGVERTSMSDRPVYDGAELKPYTGRPGANDHMQWGSVVNGRTVPYAAPSIRRTA